ncbi:MAG: hypothetical protein JWP06_558 [Candidatus Saccharibacteria bacterium]|nr:hypothetical protein [Candidatus Saccharibacteria bacterium]
MDEKKTLDDQETAPDLEQKTLVVEPVLSNLNDIQSVEDEKPAVPPLKFNIVDSSELVKKPSAVWLSFFIALAVLQIACVSLYFQAMNTATQTAKNGQSGSEFVALFALFQFLTPAFIVAVINLIALPIYVIKRQLEHGRLIASIVSVFISLAIVIFVVLGFLF